jgi:hypothetical protein
MHLRLDTDWVEQFGEWYERLGADSKSVLLDLLPEDWSFDGKRISTSERATDEPS